MKLEELLWSGKELQEVAKKLSKDDILQLVRLLREKNNKIRYQAFLLLQYRSGLYDDVYAYWHTFKELLKSENSYQRNIGLHLIAENTKWDDANKIDETIDNYLVLLHDEKPITVRQCIQGLCKIIPYKNHLQQKIAHKIMDINLANVKETMRKRILLDILNVLILIREHHTTDEIDNYISQALTGEYLDKKSREKIENML